MMIAKNAEVIFHFSLAGLRTFLSKPLITPLQTTPRNYNRKLLFNFNFNAIHANSLHPPRFKLGGREIAIDERKWHPRRAYRAFITRALSDGTLLLPLPPVPSPPLLSHSPLPPTPIS